MDDLNARVAVVTGAASGIGRGMAESFAAEGMQLMLADIEAQRLEKFADELRGSGTRVETQVVDVSKSEEVEALAERAFAMFGAVNVLCNNAGVIENNAPAWDYSLEDWDWVLGINLMGVVHGQRSFMPRMLAQEQPGHVVNTASVGGLVAGTATPIYTVSKHAVVALSECTYNALIQRQASIGLSVLCPGWVRTEIVDSDRNRSDAPALSEANERSRNKFRAGVDGGMAPRAVGDLVVEAIREARFYILTHPHWNGAIEERFAAISNGTSPPMTRLPAS
jgi:NAD(P)-dependent dehydrogenase (short-subunit alcohol dehydrogenase family)